MIKFILIAGLGMAAGIYFFGLRSQLRDRFLALLLFVTGATFVLFPNFAQAMADLVGIGRGVDLIIYLCIVAILHLIAVLAVRNKQTQDQLTKLTRAVAILDARKGGKGDE